VGPSKCPSMRHIYYQTYAHSVLRLPTSLKISNEAAQRRAEPYIKIVGELPEMRRNTVELVSKAVAENRRASVLVNNRSEFNALLIIQALVDQLQMDGQFRPSQ